MILFAMNCHSQFPSSNSFLIHQDGVKMQIKLSQSAIEWGQIGRCVQSGSYNMVINFDKLAKISRLLQAAHTKIDFNYFHSVSSQNFLIRMYNFEMCF